MVNVRSGCRDFHTNTTSSDGGGRAGNKQQERGGKLLGTQTQLTLNLSNICVFFFCFVFSSCGLLSFKGDRFVF